MALSKIITVSLNPSVDRIIAVDGFTIGAHQMGRDVARMPGGKAINVSRVLATLGLESIATGFLGSENRNEFDPILKCPSVIDEFIILPGRTRENITIVSEGRETHIRNPGLAVDSENLERLAWKLAQLSSAEAIVVFSGSLPPGITADDFRKLVRMCSESGARVAVDTSGDALQAVREETVWLVKPNREELSQMMGRKLTATPEMLAAGGELAKEVPIVLLSCGEDGAYLFTGREGFHGHVQIPAEEIKNTVGCGDAMLAAFIAAVHQGKTERQAFIEAIACASASACTFNSAEFDAGVFEKLCAQVKVTAL